MALQRFSIIALLVTAAFLAVAPFLGHAADTEYRVVTVYSSRNDPATQKLLSSFTKTTGIRTSLVSDTTARILARLTHEEVRAPADLVLIDDVSLLTRLKEEGLLAPVVSPTLNQNVPEAYRDKDGTWYGFSQRAPVFAYAKSRIKPLAIATYESLGDDALTARIASPSSHAPAIQSLIASMIAEHGDEKARLWVQRVVAKHAPLSDRDDLSLIRAVAEGRADVAIVSSDIYGRLQASLKPEDKALINKVGVTFPNSNKLRDLFDFGHTPETRGSLAIVNGGAVMTDAPNTKDAAMLLEFLCTSAAQHLYAEMNQEFPVSPHAISSKILGSWFNTTLNPRYLSTLQNRRGDALKIATDSGWK